VILWLVIALVGGSLLVLAVAVGVLLRHLGQLGIAARRLQLRLADAQRIVPGVTALQERAEQMQHEVTAIQDRAVLLKGPRVGRRDS
jgi:hypothetical protein